MWLFIKYCSWSSHSIRCHPATTRELGSTTCTQHYSTAMVYRDVYENGAQLQHVSWGPLPVHSTTVRPWCTEMCTRMVPSYNTSVGVHYLYTALQYGHGVQRCVREWCPATTRELGSTTCTQHYSTAMVYRDVYENGAQQRCISMISPQNSLSVSRSMYFSVWQAAFACSAWSRLVSCHKQSRLTTRSTLHTSHVLQCVAGRLRMQRLVSSRLLSQTVQTDNTVYSTHQNTAQYTPFQN